MCDSKTERHQSKIYTQVSLMPYYHACHGKTPLCLYLWPTVCIDSVQVLGLPLFVFSPLSASWTGKDASYQPTDRITASLYIQTLVTHFSWYIFFFFFYRWAESSAHLSSGAQLAKHRWQARCSCRLLCWYHGDQLWSIFVCGHLPGTMQTSQWDVHW